MPPHPSNGPRCKWDTVERVLTSLAEASPRCAFALRLQVNGNRLAGRAAQQKLDTRKKPINAPVMIKPSTPARRSLLRTTPSRLKIKPSGVARRKVNPPRVEMGEPHPGWNNIIAASATRGASEKQRPIRPRAALRPMAGSACMRGGCSMFGFSELDIHGLAGRRQRLEVELNVDGDFLADQVLGYSP